MQINVMSRAEIEMFLSKESPTILKDVAVISITETYNECPDFSMYLDDRVLYLQFDDVEKDEYFTNYKLQCMKEDDALKVAEFVKKIQDMGIETLVVHCYAGISRSAGVAAAISKALNNDDFVYFKMYSPNMTCYRLVYNALCM